MESDLYTADVCGETSTLLPVQEVSIQDAAEQPSRGFQGSQALDDGIQQQPPQQQQRGTTEALWFLETFPGHQQTAGDSEPAPTAAVSQPPSSTATPGPDPDPFFADDLFSWDT